MKYLYSLLLCAAITGCMQNNSGNMTNTAMNNDSLRTALLNTDKSWNDSAQSAGFFHSRSSFLSDNALELMEDAMPLDGKKAILDFTASHPDSLHIKWTPLKAVVAASGDLGYTYGAWTMQSKTKSGNDTTMYGDYMTVWQKQSDGSWKYVADTGNDTPHEVGK